MTGLGTFGAISGTQSLGNRSAWQYVHVLMSMSMGAGDGADSDGDVYKAYGGALASFVIYISRRSATDSSSLAISPMSHLSFAWNCSI